MSLANDGNVNTGNGYCALLTSGQVDCWGDNSDGQLGTGSYSPASSATPVSVDGGDFTHVTDLIGEPIGHFCARLSSGGVDCWGFGEDGMLGNGVFDPGINGPGSGSPSPVAVLAPGGTEDLANAESIVGNIGGDPEFCALLGTGGVDCWGSDSFGQLGNGEPFTGDPQSDVPVSVVKASS